MSNTKFKPRGPLDFLGALACGSVSLYARAVEWSGNTADQVLVHSPLGLYHCHPLSLNHNSCPSMACALWTISVTYQIAAHGPICGNGDKN